MTVDTHHYTFVQTHRMYTPRVNPNVNYGLWVIMMCQCRSRNCNKCVTLVGDVDNGEGYACVRVGSMWEISVPSAQFFCKPKPALKNKVYLKRERDFWVWQ